MLAIESKVEMDKGEPQVRAAKIIGLNESARQILDSYFPKAPVEWLGRDLVSELRWLELQLVHRPRTAEGDAGPEVLAFAAARLGQEALSGVVQMMADSRPRSFSLPADGASPGSPRVELFSSRLKEWAAPLQIISMRRFSVPSQDHVSQTHGLLARFAHEVRSPLTSVVLAFQQLSRLATRSEDEAGTESGTRDLLKSIRTLVEIGKVESEKCRSLAQSWLDPMVLGRGDFVPPPASASTKGAEDVELLDFRSLIEKSFGRRLRLDDHTMGAELLAWGKREAVEYAFAQYAEALRNEAEVAGVGWSVSLDADARVREIKFRIQIDPSDARRTEKDEWRELDADLISYRIQGGDGSVVWWSMLRWRDLLASWGWSVKLWVHPEVQMPQAELSIPMF